MTLIYLIIQSFILYPIYNNSNKTENSFLSLESKKKKGKSFLLMKNHVFFLVVCENEWKTFYCFLHIYNTQKTYIYIYISIILSDPPLHLTAIPTTSPPIYHSNTQWKPLYCFCRGEGQECEGLILFFRAHSIPGPFTHYIDSECVEI